MIAPDCPTCKKNINNYQLSHDVASDYSFLDIWFQCGNPDCMSRYMADFRLNKVITEKEATE